MRLWNVFGTLFSLLASGSALPPSDMAQFWRESPITLEFMREHVSNVKCHSSPEYWASCRAALAEVNKLLPEIHFNAPDDFDLVLKQIDARNDVKISKQFIYGRMLNAHLKAFDAHAFLLPGPAVEAMLGAESRARFGIGVHFLPTLAAGLFVGTVNAQSPASQVGLRPGDRVLSIDGHSVGQGMLALDALSRLAGRPGDILALEIEHEGKRKNLRIPVGVIDEENVTGALIPYQSAAYAYVHLRQFRDGSCTAVEKKITELSAHAQGVILDLRDNMGGRLDEGICLAALFMGRQKIVGEKLVDVKVPLYVGPVGKESKTMDWRSGEKDATFASVPLVVLVNPISASASEIVAGALQDSQRAWIVGESSFGKGTIQAVRPLSADERFTVGFTVAMFYRPGGSTIQLSGVIPNFRAPYLPNTSKAERQVLREQDINPNALKPTGPNPAWKEPRNKLSVQISSCVSTSGKDADVYRGIKTTADYQTAYAVAILECSAQHNTLAEQE